MITLFPPYPTSMLKEQNLTHIHSTYTLLQALSGVVYLMAKSGPPENRGETQTLNYRGTRGATVLRIEVTARDLFVSFYYMSQLRN